MHGLTAVRANAAHGRCHRIPRTDGEWRICAYEVLARLSVDARDLLPPHVLPCTSCSKRILTVHRHDEFLQTMVNFHDYLDARGNFEEPSSLTKNPYSWRHNQDGKTTWEIMAQYPERMKIYQLGLANQDAILPVVGLYDFGKLNTTDTRPIMVDVGGGQGQSLVQILNHHQELAAEKMILQDLPAVIELAKTSEALPKGVVKMTHDFFGEQPVKGWLVTLLSLSKLLTSTRCQSLFPPPHLA